MSTLCQHSAGDVNVAKLPNLTERRLADELRARVLGDLAARGYSVVEVGEEVEREQVRAAVRRIARDAGIGVRTKAVGASSLVVWSD